MLQKEEKITIVLLVMAVLVLIIAYFGFVAQKVEAAEYSEQSAVGDSVVLKGEVVGKRGTFTGDHLILTIDARGSLVKVFIHRNSGAAQVNGSVDVTDTVEIIGLVDEYEGEQEIVLKGPEDITILEESENVL